jgi:hypothetical protein
LATEEQESASVTVGKGKRISKIRYTKFGESFCATVILTGIQFSAASNGVGSLDVKGSENSGSSGKGEEFHLGLKG